MQHCAKQLRKVTKFFYKKQIFYNLNQLQYNKLKKITKSIKNYTS